MSLLFRMRVFLAEAIAVVFPHACVGCGEEGALACAACITEKLDPLTGFFVCPGCGVRVAELGRCGERACAASALDGMVAAGAYGDPFLRELLRAWKFERVPEAGEVVLDAFWKFAAGKQEAFVGQEDARVFAVPMHPFRVALRGFDQGRALAEVFAHGVGLPFADSPLEMRWRLRTQVGTGDVDARKRNAEGSVRAMGATPRSVVLVDDVATTGATLVAGAVALRAAGTRRVYGVTFLHG